MEESDLSVILLTSDHVEPLRQALAHLELQTYPAGRFEILVIDLAASSQRREMLERYAAGAPIRTRYLHSTEENPAGARNVGIREATGRWVLFLDADLLARRELVEAHVRAQKQRQGNAAILGRVSRHPQVDAATLTKWHQAPDRTAVEEAMPLPFLEWRASNLSLPRGALIDVGGFDTSFQVAGFEDLELAWRLEQRGLQGFYARDAGAHAWRPTTIQAERQRAYGEGYSLPRLFEKTGAKEIRRRFLGRAPRLQLILTSLTLPICKWVCAGVPPHIALFHTACRHVLRHAFLRGYYDALDGLFPRNAQLA